MPEAAQKFAGPEIGRALREALFTGLLAFGLLLPLIGFNTVQNIRNELVLETRWGLFFVLVGLIAGGRFVYSLVIGPWLARRKGRAVVVLPDALRTAVARWAIPSVAGFVILYPLLVILLKGPVEAAKWIDNFGVQILIYVMLGWGLNIAVGLAGLLDLGYVASYAIGAYTCALLGKNFGLSFWMLLPLAGLLAAFCLLGHPARLSGVAFARRLSRGGDARFCRDRPSRGDQLGARHQWLCGSGRHPAADPVRHPVRCV